MKPNATIRHIDEYGRIILPKEIRRALCLETGEPVEIYTNKQGEVVLKKYKKSWEDTALEWWAKNYNRPAMQRSDFARIGDYTFCVLRKPSGNYVTGFAKRFIGDKDDDRIGKIAAFAHAIDTPIDKLIGWKG